MTDPSEGFRLRAEQVARAITPRTKLLIVNSPSNPSGAVVPPDEFARIYEVCRAKNIWLMTDECYSHFLYGKEKPFSLASLPGTKPNIIVAGSLSKTFAMTGWRVGYALAPEPLISAMIKLQSQSTSNATSIAQYAALEALTGPMDAVAVMLAEYARRRDRIVAGLRAIPGVTCTEPGGAFYAFPSVAAHLGKGVADTTALAKQLLERQHVVVVPVTPLGRPATSASPTPRRLTESRRACGASRNSSRRRNRLRESRFKPLGAGACAARPRLHAPHLGRAQPLSTISRPVAGTGTGGRGMAHGQRLPFRHGRDSPGARSVKSGPICPRNGRARACAASRAFRCL